MPYRPRLGQHNQTVCLEINISRRKDALLDTVGNNLLQKTLNTFLSLKQAPPLCRGQGFHFLVPKDDIFPHFIRKADMAFVGEEEELLRVSSLTLESLEFCPLFLQRRFRARLHV